MVQVLEMLVIILREDDDIVDVHQAHPPTHP